MLVELLADAADVGLGDPQPEPLDKLIDAPRRNAEHIGLLDDRQQRLLGPLPGLQKAREIAALPELGDLQLQLPRPGVPAPRPIPVAMRRPILRATLTTAGADQLGHLELHHLRRDRLDGLTDHIGVLIEQHLPDDLLDRHPVSTGHAAPPFIDSVERDDEKNQRRVGRNHHRQEQNPRPIPAVIPSDPDLHQP